MAAAGSGSGAGFFDSLIGLRLGGYVVKRMIARGGMGVVYEGHQESLDRKVAIKILYPHLSDDESFRERFQHEARSAAQLRHPNIVRVIDFGVDSGYLYMVMELVEGHSLRDELVKARESGKRLSIPRSVEILSAVGSALAYAHGLGLVHRDVKPGNILIDNSGHIFLTDFGLVKLAGAGGMTATGAVIGTPEYMAPEQYISTTDAGPAADQYALAVVAYEMLAGHAPFQAPTPVGLMQKHLNEMPEPVRSMDPDVSPEVDSVIMKALAKEPAQRYPSISDFVHDLTSSTADTRQLNATALPTDATPTVMDIPRPPDATVFDPTPAAAAGVAAAGLAGTAAAGLAGTSMPTGGTGASGRPVSGPVFGAGAGAPPPTSPPSTGVVSDRPGRPSWLPFAIGGGALALIAVLAIFLLGGDDSGGGGGTDPTATVQSGVVNAPSTATTAPTVPTTASGEPTATTEPAAPTEQVAQVETPTPEPQPTNTPEPEPTETVVNVPPTPTTGAGQPTPTRPPIVERPIVNAPTPTPGQIAIPTPATADEEFAEALTSTFDTEADAAEWPVAQDRSDFAINFVDGYYVVDVLANEPDGYSLYSFPSSASNIADGVIGATILIEGQGFAGVMARGTGGETGIDSMYECQYSNSGEFSCFKQVAGEWTEIVPLQFTDAIVPDGFNTIIYAVIANEHALLINDVEVASWTDDSLAGAGAWGVFVERSPGAESMRASYDTVIVLEGMQ